MTGQLMLDHPMVVDAKSYQPKTANRVITALARRKAVISPHLPSCRVTTCQKNGHVMRDAVTYARFIDANWHTDRR